METSGSIALVTGGSRGIGKDVVRSVSGRGTDVIFTYESNEAAAEALVSEVEGTGRRAVALRLDAGDVETFDAFVKQVQDVLQDWGTDRFQYLVNNAGLGLYASIADTTEAQFDEIMDVHVKGPFFLTKRLLPLISDGGRIVNVSTALTRWRYLSRAGDLRHGKGGSGGNDEVPGSGARVASDPREHHCAGGIETDFMGGAMRDPGLQELATSVTALGRVGQPEDVGGVVASLLSPETGWVNGQRIEVSGGQNL